MWAPFKRLTDRWAEQKRQQEEILQQVRQAGDEIDRDIKPLPTDEAKRRAEALLSDGTRFECNRTPPTDEEQASLDIFAPLLREFFQEYAHVSTSSGLDHLDRRHEPALEIIQGVWRESERFIKIGQDGEHGFVAAKSAGEAIYVFDGEGEPSDEEPNPESDYASIYHYILALDRWNEG
jgi:hypothetical protein